MMRFSSSKMKTPVPVVFETLAAEAALLFFLLTALFLETRSLLPLEDADAAEHLTAELLESLGLLGSALCRRTLLFRGLRGRCF